MTNYTPAEIAAVNAKDDRKDSEARESLECEYSDAYKAATGFRPRGDYAWRDWSSAVLDAEITAYYREARDDARIPTSGEGWAFDGEAEFFEAEEGWDF